MRAASRSERILAVCLGLVWCAGSIEARAEDIPWGPPETSLLHPAPSRDCAVSPYRERIEALAGGERRLGIPPEDNVEDPGVEILAELSSGSAFAGTRVTLAASSGRRVEATFEVDFASLVNRHAVPPELRGPEEESWRRMLEHAAFGRVCDQPDPSLAWLLENDPGSRAPVWIAGRPEMPESYTLRYMNPVTRQLEWVEYLGLNHRRITEDSMSDEFELLDQRGALQLLRTGHGALLRTTEPTDAYAWIYVFRGGHKLRWPSVIGGRLEARTVVLDLRPAESESTPRHLTIDLAPARATRPLRRRISSSAE